MSSARGTDYDTVKSHQQKLFSHTASVSKRPQVAAEPKTTYAILQWPQQLKLGQMAIQCIQQTNTVWYNKEQTLKKKKQCTENNNFYCHRRMLLCYDALINHNTKPGSIHTLDF